MEGIEGDGASVLQARIWREIKAKRVPQAFKRGKYSELPSGVDYHSDKGLDDFIAGSIAVGPIPHEDPIHSAEHEERREFRIYGRKRTVLQTFFNELSARSADARSTRDCGGPI